MEIVCSNTMLRKFRGIKEFTMDLGTSLMQDARKEGAQAGSNIMTIKIKDPFVKKYSMEYDNYIMKMGSVGTLGFYVDNTFGFNQFRIFDGAKIYEFQYSDTKEDIRTYLSNILDGIFEEEINPIEVGRDMEEEIYFTIDKNLPQAEFIKQYNEMKKKMDEMNIKLGKR